MTARSPGAAQHPRNRGPAQPFEKACKNLSRRGGSDAIVKNQGLSDKIEQGGSGGGCMGELESQILRPFRLYGKPRCSDPITERQRNRGLVSAGSHLNNLCKELYY